MNDQQYPSMYIVIFTIGLCLRHDSNVWGIRDISDNCSLEIK